MTGKTTVIYHQDCADGFGAAYAAWLKLGNTADYIPARYGDPPPELQPYSQVYILDFSYPRDTIVDMSKTNSVTLLDHHKTAQQDLQGMAGCLIDTTKSGAVLAWEHFHLHQPTPTLLEYVQDRDLWKFQLPDSRAINAYIHSNGYDFGAWTEMRSLLKFQPHRAVEMGEAIMRVQAYQLGALTNNARFRDIGGYQVPTVCAPILQSEIGERLLQLHPDTPFAGIYYERDDGRKWSLRSRPDFDVSEIARSLGGGGHPQASGFVEPLTQ